ncbi:unnamed protein product [Rotaria sordida]|uniref:Uncharacterized protein n=1 Tax=Rotaria sordida TaxID=392033 RepID=A0A819MPC4_9BILA|nr:unnamed protein product [Rotaria sordida]
MRSANWTCLDWSEICDGKIDCLDGGHDEEHCWQLEINECQPNEYRCANGQCIPIAFLRNYDRSSDCLDGTDEKFAPLALDRCSAKSPTFACEEIMCNDNDVDVYSTMAKRSCLRERGKLALQKLLSNKPNAISNECWSALYRLNDGISDCYFDDDEKYLETENICSPTSNIKCYECKSKSKFIHYNRLKDGLCDCPHYCDDEVPNDYTVYIQEHISFQTICDGFTELLPIMIDGQNETDETNCEQWVCDNIYTRCNTIWNCLNGADELNCPDLRVSNCTSNEHPCVSPKGNEFICLPIEKANDGVVDCLGATDEPQICRSYRLLREPPTFYCENRGHLNCINHLLLCNNQSECNNDEDERFCSKYSNYIKPQEGVCGQPLSTPSKIEKFLCGKVSSDGFKHSLVYFKLGQNEQSIVSTKNSVSTRILPSPNQNKNLQRRCNRGMDMRVWLADKDNSTTTTCLCPPSYYGDTCQYQNQRPCTSTDCCQTQHRTYNNNVHIWTHQ